VALKLLFIGMISGEQRSYGACDFEVDFRKRTVEPRPMVRGQIARAMFYMKDSIEIFAKLGKQLLQWHMQYLPTEEKKRRNAEIDELQFAILIAIEYTSLRQLFNPVKI